MKKDVEIECTAYAACLISGENLKYQLLFIEKLNLSVLNEPKKDLQIDFSGESRDKNVTGELFMLNGSDQYSKVPVVWVCKPTPAKKFVTYAESLINLYRESNIRQR